MNAIIQITRRSLVLFVLSGWLLLLSGCAIHNIPIYASTTTTTPALTGKTVAVLPPVTVAGEAKIAIDAGLAMEAVFSGDIAGIHFTNGSPLLDRLLQQPDSFNAMYRQVTNSLPAHFKPVEIADGSGSVAPASPSESADSMKPVSKVLLESNTIAGVQRDAFYNMTLDLATMTSSLAPGQLDATLTGSIAADYVLLSAPFGDYVQLSRTAALYGILPIMGGGNMYLSPRGLFALYDGKSGQKVWEGQIGTSAISLNIEQKGRVSEMSHIILGASYLLTGDAETSLARVLAMSDLPK